MILLDTHVLVWWVGGDIQKLSEQASRALAAAQDDGRIYVSAISAWEFAALVARGRIGLALEPQAWLDEVGRSKAVEFVPLDNSIAVQSTRLPGDFHKDPADRFIVATSRHIGVPVVTADDKILHYEHVRPSW